MPGTREIQKFRAAVCRLLPGFLVCQDSGYVKKLQQTGFDGTKCCFTPYNGVEGPVYGLEEEGAGI